MGHLLHGSARTTAAVCRAIQHSQESIGRLAERYHVNPKTVAKSVPNNAVECAMKRDLGMDEGEFSR